MAASQNGWPVVAKISCDLGPFEGVMFPNGILRGDVATIARWQMRRYKATVESIVPGTCWGWDPKKIQGSDQWSNHASGTAWDINAPEHPMGPPTGSNMTAREIAACHAIEAASGGTLRWGGDFSRPDPMHWEIIGSRAQVAAFAASIRAGEDDMTQAQFNVLMDAWWTTRMDYLASTPSKALKQLRVAPWQQGAGSGGSEPSTLTVMFLIRDAVNRLSGVDVDENAIVTGLLATLTPQAIAAALPEEIADAVVDEIHARTA